MVPLTWVLSELKIFFFKRKTKWIEKKSRRKTQKSYGAQRVQQDTENDSHSENRWIFRCLRNVAEESASLIVLGHFRIWGQSRRKLWNLYTRKRLRKRLIRFSRYEPFLLLEKGWKNRVELTWRAGIRKCGIIVSRWSMQNYTLTHSRISRGNRWEFWIRSSGGPQCLYLEETESDIIIIIIMDIWLA